MPRSVVPLRVVAGAHPRREPLASRRGIGAALWGACILLLIAAVSLVLNGSINRGARADNAMLSELRLNAELLLTELKDVETGQRGYLLTGRPVFLDPYNDARPRVGPALDRLLGEARDAGFGSIVVPLHDLVERKLTRADGIIAAVRAGQWDAARAEPTQSEGKAVMDAVRAVIAALSQEIDRHRKAVEDRTRVRAAWTLAVALAAAVGGSLMVGVTALIVSRFSSQQLQFVEEGRILALGAAALGTWEWDWRTDRVTASAAMQRMFGLPEDRPLTSRDLLDAVYPQDRAQAESALRCAAEHDTCEWEGRIGTENGPVRWVRIMAELYYTAERPSFLRGVAQDVTRRQEAIQHAREVELELWHATRLSMVGEATATLAHELSQPLSAASTYLHGCSGLIHAGPPYDIASITEGVDYGLEALDRASEIVRNLQRFLRRQTLHREPVPVNDAVKDAVRLGTVGFRGGRIVCELADHLPPVWADRTLIQQVVVNLVRNAVEAMAQSSEPALQIATARDDGEIIIRVSDNGPGLAPAIAEAPFRAFATTKPTGLGLGLSICRSIIEAHGGSIAFATGSSGATFCVRLPAVLEEPNVQAA